VIRGSVPVPHPKPGLTFAALRAGEIVIPKPRDAMAVHAGQSSLAPSLAGMIGRNNWTIQIGAFDDAATAQAELASYAARSVDILGQVARIVAPFESSEGHVLYRARFGPFAEHAARQVCQVLTERGQTCFAALASR
jgi:D-alanyl-D-alanine carboxypeptidase